jgi:hypothetical protein
MESTGHFFVALFSFLTQPTFSSFSGHRPTHCESSKADRSTEPSLVLVLGPPARFSLSRLSHFPPSNLPRALSRHRTHCSHLTYSSVSLISPYHF